MAQPHRTNVNWMLLLLCGCLAAAQVQQSPGGGTGVEGASEGGGTDNAQLAQSPSVKKALRVDATAPDASPPAANAAAAAPAPTPKVQLPDEAVPEEHVVVISERTQLELEATAKRKAATEAAIAAAAGERNDAHKEVPAKVLQPPLAESPDGGGGHQVHVEESSFKQRILHMDNPEMDLDSFQMGFYFFVGLSSLAILFIVFKVYRLRLSRAERKYGVQGDRSTQELTPLPISIEDGNSDEDDQTLFEINRQQIRIL